MDIVLVKVSMLCIVQRNKAKVIERVMRLLT